MSLTSLDLNSFDPIPLPTIALVASVVSSSPHPHSASLTICKLHNCLEEYATGEYAEIPYSEDEYRSFYFDIMDNLLEYSESSSRSHLIDKIQRDMFRAGVFVRYYLPLISTLISSLGRIWVQ